MTAHFNEAREKLAIAPDPLVKSVIVPHAAVRFSGHTAAQAYAALDPAHIRRVVLLGPSHHTYLSGCAVSTFAQLETPLGDLRVDISAAAALLQSRTFTALEHGEDMVEHSLEMQLPFLRFIMGEGADADADVAVVPIVVGMLTRETAADFAAMLAPLLADSGTIAVVSSDFCHWGLRFAYTRYQAPDRAPVTLTQRTPREVYSHFPIHASIAALDRQAMDKISRADGDMRAAAEAFAQNLALTRNTVCGRNPIYLLLHALAALGDTHRFACRFTHYEQSSACDSVMDSSVSYAAAVIRAEATPDVPPRAAAAPPRA